MTGKRSVLPVVAAAADIPNSVLGEASTKAQAKKLVAKRLNCPPEQVQIEKIGLDNLLNTAGIAFWQYSIVAIVDRPMKVEDAIALLKLPEEFDLVALKTAYRIAVKAAHPDAGGSEDKFIQVDRAYDLLLTLMARGDSQEWSAYVLENLAKWEQEFRAEWKSMVGRGLQSPESRFGLWYSTTRERFTRRAIEPLPDWYLNCIYGSLIGGGISIAEIRQRYRDHLITIAPNKTMAEVWARKYWCLEFGESVPWVFYLPPAKEVNHAA